MGCYVVIRNLPGIMPEALAGAGLRAKSCAAEMTEEGTPVQWLRSYFIPERRVSETMTQAADQLRYMV